MPQKKGEMEENRREAEAGRSAAVIRSIGVEAIRTISVTPFTYYLWRKEFSRLKSNQGEATEGHQEGECRLRKAISNLTPEKLILKEAHRETGELHPSSPLHRPRHRAIDTM